jgi:hypothetical protein
MTLASSFEQIESVRFAAIMGTASGFNVFKNILADDDDVKILLQYSQDHPRQTQDVYRRLLMLLDSNDHPEYAHPYDAALAGYLYVLSIVAPDLASLASERIRKTPQLWWTIKLARQVLENARKNKSGWVVLGAGTGAKLSAVFWSRDESVSYAVHIARPRLLNQPVYDTHGISSSLPIGGSSKVDYRSVKSTTDIRKAVV